MARNGTAAIIVLLFVVLIGITLRLFVLTNDAPFHFTGGGQDLVTDPYHLTVFARNFALFGNADPYPFPAWDVFKYSAVSGLAFPVFLLLGVTTLTANLVGTALNLTGIILFLLALYRSRGARTTLISAALLMFNLTLIIYGRLPFLENGMIFFMGLLFYLYVLFGNKMWALPLYGMIIAFCALAGKLFGGMMIIAVAGPIVLAAEPGRWKKTAILSGSTILVGLAWLLVMYGGHAGALFRYYTVHTLEVHGTPFILSAPHRLIPWLVTFGTEARFYLHNPVFAFLTFVAGVMLLASSGGMRDKLRDDPILAFLIFWITTALLVIAPHSYRPLRYFFYLLLPLSGFIAVMFTERGTTYSFRANGRIRWLRLAILWALSWHMVYQLAAHLMYGPSVASRGGAMIWPSLLMAVPVTLGVLWLVDRNAFKFSAIGKMIVVGSLVMLCVSVQLLSGFDWLTSSSERDRVESRALGKLCNTNQALMTGPYAPALTIDNNLRMFIYNFDLPVSDKSIFDQYPITHVLLGRQAIPSAIEKYPFLSKAVPLAEFWFNGFEVVLEYIDRSGFDDGRRAPYEPSAYELAHLYMVRGQPDSALAAIDRHLKDFPDSRYGLLTALRLYYTQGMARRGINCAKKIGSTFPDDFYLQSYAAAIMRAYAEKTGIEEYRRYAELYRDRALAAAPYMSEYITALYALDPGR